jgi:hypothetical protein
MARSINGQITVLARVKSLVVKRLFLKQDKDSRRRFIA